MSKREKQKDLSHQGLTAVLDVAWFTSEQYERLLGVAAEREDLENTYEEWKASAEKEG